ncbi:MAG: Wzy polymerase domain-containing protein [Betaproteobacteria bacterium]
MSAPAMASRLAPSAWSSPVRLLAFLVAVAGPLLLNQPLPPVFSHPAQIAAVFGWGLVLLLVPGPAPQRRTLRAIAPLLGALAVVASGCALSMACGGCPASTGVATLGLLALAAAVALHGASWGARRPLAVSTAFNGALVFAALCGVVMAIVQVFDVHRRTDTFIAFAPSPDRAAGNLGQPNQFADTLLWALAALVALAEPARRSRGATAAFAVATLLILFATVLTGSRTALVGVLLLALWGLLDGSLRRASRVALVALPFAAAAMMAGLPALTHAFGGSVAPLSHGADPTSFRGLIWSDTLALIAQQPWLGVGWAQYNFAWSLTPFAARPAGLVANAHDLPLQLAVELGVPAAVLVMGLLAGAAWLTWQRLRRLPGTTGVQARAAAMVVLVIGLHSLLEYPLWFAYLLLPASWAWGLALGVAGEAGRPVADCDDGAPTAPRAWRVLGLSMMVAGASAWLDYRNIVELYRTWPADPTFEQRIVNSQQSPLFAPLGDYVAATRPAPPAQALPDVMRTSHLLINGWLLQAWAHLLHVQGQADKARYLAARLREFDGAEAKSWFAPCNDAAIGMKPWQCEPPAQAWSWRDFR